jgi:hypothetical protein
LIEKRNYLIEFIIAVWESKGIIYKKYYVLKKKRIQGIFKKFSKTMGITSCYILDEKGVIIATNMALSPNKSIERKIIQIYQTLLKFSGKKIGTINFHDKIELISFNEHPDFLNNTSLMILKSIINGFILLTIIPNESFLSSVLPAYKKTLKQLNKCFKIRKATIV